MWKTLSPFWGEEYEVHLQPSFHSVSIYVMDEDALRYGQVAAGTRQGLGLGSWSSALIGDRQSAQPRSRHQRTHSWPRRCGF